MAESKIYATSYTNTEYTIYQKERGQSTYSVYKAMIIMVSL